MVFPVKVIDTSYLLSFFIADDENHAKAMKISAENEQEDFVLPNAILHETLTVLNYKRGLEDCKRAYKEITGNKQVTVNFIGEKEQNDIVKWFLENGKGLSIGDASVICAANRLNCEALAFDKDLLRRISRKGKE